MAEAQEITRAALLTVIDAWYVKAQVASAQEQTAVYAYFLLEYLEFVPAGVVEALREQLPWLQEAAPQRAQAYLDFFAAVEQEAQKS